jgi:hypothetical protein
MEDDLQTILDGIIGEEYVREETGQEDLSTIVHLALKIDTSRQSVYDVHQFLPNLQHLVLDNSVITSVRDLGIGLRFIVSLSLSSCGLIDIDGIGVLTGLQELNLSDNSIADVTPLAMHENLQVLRVVPRLYRGLTKKFPYLLTEPQPQWQPSQRFICR